MKIKVLILNLSDKLHNHDVSLLIIVPPFHLRLINGSPRVTEDSLSVDFTTSKPATSTCFLVSRLSNQQNESDCKLGNISHSCN